jgi:hypothetical protein
MVSVTGMEMPEPVAVISATALVVTAGVVMLKFTVFAPAGTVTEAGTVANLDEDVSETVVPPTGAGPVSVTVPLHVVPPTTGFGEAVSVVGTGGTKVTIAVD